MKIRKNSRNTGVFDFKGGFFIFSFKSYTCASEIKVKVPILQKYPDSEIKAYD